MCLCHVATLFFTLPSFLISSLPMAAPKRQPAEDCRQNQTTVEPDDPQNQTTVPRTRRPFPEPDDRSNDQPTNTTNDSINQSIELNQSFDIGPSPNQIKAS